MVIIALTPYKQQRSRSSGQSICSFIYDAPRSNLFHSEMYLCHCTQCVRMNLKKNVVIYLLL